VASVGPIVAELRAGDGYHGPVCAPCLKAYDRDQC
jgi:hypothetical protein